MKTLILSILLLCTVFLSSTLAATFFTDSFESGDFTHTEGTSQWTGTDGDYPDYVVVSNDMAHSGSYSAKFHFDGNADLTDDAWAQLIYQVSSSGEPEWYLSYYMYLPTNYIIRNATGTDNTKLHTVWGDTYSAHSRFNTEIQGTDHVVAVRKKRANPWPWEYATCDPGAALEGGPDTPNWYDILDTRGRWVHWEYYFKMDTGAGDGEYSIWVDEVEVLTETAIDVIGAPCNPYYMKNGYLMGWSNSGFTDDTDVYIDDVTFSTTFSGESSNPTISIIDPTSISTYATNTTPITTLAGTASDDVSVSSVTWACPTCTPTSGSATGTTSWSIASIGLASTDNVITVTATDGDTNTGEDVITVTYPTSSVGEFTWDSITYQIEEGPVTYVTITVNRLGGSTGAVSVDWETIDQTALDIFDFVGDSGVTLNFADSETTKDIVIEIVNDDILENTEYFHVLLSNPIGGATINSADYSIITIIDDDAPGTVLLNGGGSTLLNLGSGGSTINIR